MRSGMRPMSANPPSQSRGLIARTFNEKSSTGNMDNVAKIWTAFGRYVEKTLKSGKGVGIPKFGVFTFTPMQVDLAGSTNPDKRDLQIREPIFQVAKDFVLGMPMQPGFVHENGVLRPYEIKGTSGIVPKVKINYTEIGYIAGVSKEDAKHGCDIVIRDLSDKVKSGQSTQLMIPNVGTFLYKNKVVGVKFNPDVVQGSKGKTSKGHFVGKLFASSVNRANLDLLDKVAEGIRTRPSKFEQSRQRIPVVGRHDNTITVTPDAEDWLKRNLGVSLANGEPSEYRKGGTRPRMKRTFSARPGFSSTHSEQATSIKTGDVPMHFPSNTIDQEPTFKIRSSSKKKRPMSAYSGGSRMSRASSVKSAASVVPKMTRATALNYCNKIGTKAVLDEVKSSKFSARDKLSPSEIQQILQNSGIYMDIATVRGFLNHLDFPAHGKSCSILDLIRKCKDWSSTTQKARPLQVSASQAPPSLYSIEELVGKIRDCFYKTGKSIKEIFEIGCDTQGAIDEEAFAFVCKRFCYPTISEPESRHVFQACYRNVGTNLYFNDFRNIFASVAPKNNFHIEGLKLIRDWMYKNGLTSEQAFESFVSRSAGPTSRETINLTEFEKVMKRLFNLTSPEIEAVFVAVDENNDGLIDREEWLNKIYEDSGNPLQLLREVVNENNLSSDDLLFRMNLRIWDDPLDFPKFAKALRILDPSLTDVQLRAMAKSMKNSKNLVEVPTLMKNLVGKDYETVDFRDKLYKRLYNEILDTRNSGRKDLLRDLLVKYDTLNDGTIVAQDLNKVLSQVCTNVKSSDIEKFVRFLEKDVRGRIDYTQFIDNLEKVKDHNPFKNLVSRIKSFMTQNNQNVESFMRRLVLSETQTGYDGSSEAGLEKERKVSVSYFAKFLKNKVDKKRDLNELNKYAELIDLDNDGYISIYDMQTCLGNLNNETFYKDNGATLVGTFKTILTEREKFFPKQPLPNSKALEVIAKIKESLVSKGISLRELFSRLDVNGDEFLTYTEFSENMDPIVKLSPLVKEQLFALMDVNKIGMVDYNAFLTVLKMTPVSAKVVRVNDNFDWEYDMINRIKQWIKDEGITVEEAFKAFDRDFDGFIDLNDLKWILTNILKVGDKSTINASQLERLFKLLDFHKDGHIQRCDIQRLVENDNPYLTTGKLSNAKFMVGTDTFDWKNNAIQQIGIALSKSKNYNSLQQCFKAASHNLGKVKYKDFKEFMEETHALKGFNLTDQLLQQLFSELDPHKKGFLSETDWMAAFGGFNWRDQLIVELEDLMACTFADIDSAYEYFQVIGKSKDITYASFKKQVDSLLGGKSNNYPNLAGGSSSNESDRKYLWKYFAGDNTVLDYESFCNAFGSIRFTGTSTLRKAGKSLHGTTLVSQTASSSKWSLDVMEKFRKIIKSSNMHLRDIFEKFDADGNGYITPLEFRHAVRALNLSLTSREIDEIIKVVDRNMDGMIDWQEFSFKFKPKDHELLIETRSKNKMAKLKEQLTLHMKSPQDAFELFDKSKNGRLTFTNFHDLIKELSSLSSEPVPPFSIIKDMFDEIDIRKDGEIDLKEWNQTFLVVQEGDKRYSLKKVSQPLAEFEVSRDAKLILEAIRRNRKFLNEKFSQKAVDGTHVTFEDAKEIIRAVQRGKEIEDEQYKVIFKGAMREHDMVDYKLLGRDIKAKFA